MEEKLEPGVAVLTELQETSQPMARGWECPKCGNVMAPWQAWCLFCTGRTERAPTDRKWGYIPATPEPGTGNPLRDAGTRTSDPLPPNPIVVSAGG